MEFKDEIRILVGKNELDTAIKLLIKRTNKGVNLDKILLQQAIYYDITSKVANGTVPNSEIDIEFNKLRENLLKLLRTNVDKINTTEEDVFSVLSESFSRVETCNILLEHYKLQTLLTIRGIILQSQSSKRKFVVKFLNYLERSNLLEKKKSNNKPTEYILNIQGAGILTKFVK